MYVLIYVPDGWDVPMVVPNLSMEEVELRVLALGLGPEDYAVVAGEVTKNTDHPFHAWE